MATLPEMPSVITGFTPDGPPGGTAEGGMHRSEHGRILCDRTDAPAAGLKALRDAVAARKDAFAYSLKDLVGYKGRWAR